jgi:hypothetical protein
VSRVFLLSPANPGGQRAAMLFRPGASFDLARRLQSEGAPIGEVFAFISGLYFRGKLAYARAFTSNALVITPSRGLVPIDTLLTAARIREFAAVDVDPDNPKYRKPLERDLARVAASMPGETEFVLLGSIASGKYVEILLDHMGDRLLFPETFIGRGDMSRGGIMLRAARDGEELAYIKAAGAVRRGQRPPKLEPIRWTDTPLRLPVLRRT